MDRSPQPLRGFVRVLWIPLVGAIPVAALFGTIDWLGWLGYRIAYSFTLMFAYPIALCVWATHAFLLPRVRQRSWRRRRIFVREVLPTTLSALVGALLGVLLLEAMQPGIIGVGLGMAKVLVWTLYFTALTLAASYAFSFHRDAVERARTDEELRLARQLQRTLLGNVGPEGLTVDLHAAIVPSRQVSGDFYDVIPGSDGTLLVAMADVAGERMPAALLASMLLASLRMQAAARASVGEIVRRVNWLACRGRITEERLFATMFVARFYPRTMQLSYTNAGHRHPMVFRRSGEPMRLDKGGTVVGVLETFPYEEATVSLQPGDRLLVFTDGAVEAANPRREMFGEDRLSALVRSAPVGQRSQQTVEELLAKLAEFQAGQEAGDDVAVMLLQVPSSS